MAASTPPANPADPPVVKVSFDWDNLLPSTDAPAHVVSTSKVDVTKDVPAALRARIETALVEGIVAKAAWVAAEKNPDNFRPTWKLQPVASEEQGKEFVKLVTKYGKYRPDHWDGRDSRTPEGQITVRTGAPILIAKDSNGAKLPIPYWGVRYQAKPLETKTPKRLPGTADSPTDPATDPMAAAALKEQADNATKGEGKE